MNTLRNVLVLGLPALLSAQQTAPVIRAVPANSTVVIEFGGLAGYRSSWREHGLAGIVDDAFGFLGGERRAEVIGEWKRRIAPRVQRILQRIDVSPVTIRSLLQGPAVVALGRPTVASGMMMPSIVVIVDVTGAPRAAERAVSRLRQFVGAQRCERTSMEGFDVGIARLANPAIDRVYTCIDDGKLLVSNSRGYFHECLAALRGRQPRVVDLPGYKAGRKHLHGRALASVWINTQPLLDVLVPLLPYEADAIGAALGVSAMRGIFVGAGTDGASGTEVLHVGLSGNSKGLLRAGLATPGSLTAARYCSPDTVAFAAGSLDPAAFFESLRGIFEGLPDWLRREAHREAGGALKRIEVVAERLSVLTGQVAVACSVPKGVPIPEITILAGVRDEAVVTDLLRKLMSRVHRGGIKTLSFQGTEIHCITVEVQGFGIAPCFACKNGMLLVSTHPRILKSALRRGSQENADSLWTTPAFQRVVPQAKGSTLMGWVATGAVAARFYPQLEAPLRTWVRHQGVDPNVVPDAEDLIKALDSVLVTWRVDADGITGTSRSPVGEGSMLALLGYLADRALADLIRKDI